MTRDQKIAALLAEENRLKEILWAKVRTLSPAKAGQLARRIRESEVFYERRDKVRRALGG